MPYVDKYEYFIRILQIVSKRKCSYSHVVERSCMSRKVINPLLFYLVDNNYIQNIIPPDKKNTAKYTYKPPYKQLYITSKGMDLLFKLKELMSMVQTKDKNKYLDL